jgi:hypothetical protein
MHSPVYQEDPMMNPPNQETKGSGLAGSLKVIVGLCVLALALLAILLVLEVIPQSMFQEVITKVLLVAGIAAVASVALWVVMKIGMR